MKVLKFKIRGNVNSFRYNDYKKYHPTYLTPPKTTIIGMIANLLQKGEKELYKLYEDFKISIVIKKLEGQFTDLWGYQQFSGGKTRGRSVVRRDKLYKMELQVYLASSDKLMEEIEHVLKFPPNVFSLGMDDELVSIEDVKTIVLDKIETKNIDSIFVNKNFNTFLSEENKQMIYPREITQAIDFTYPFDKKGKRIQRKASETIGLIEYYNCKVEFISSESAYYDKDDGLYLEFF